MKELTWLLLTVTIFVNGCAYGTLINGTSQEVLFNSRPDGADVAVNGQKIGKTPVSWKLPRKNSGLVEFEKKDCGKKQVMISSNASAIMIANALPFLFIGLIVGSVIDMMSGGGYNLDPNPVYVSLDCDGAVKAVPMN